MDRRTRENLLYVAESVQERYGRRVFVVLFVGLLATGAFWGFQKVDAYLTPEYVKERQEAEQRQKVAEAVQALSSIDEAYIAIPKIGAVASISFVNSTDPDDFVEPLKNGVVHYPSVLPGQQGAAVILGHSAPPGWLGNAFDGVFSDLKDLEQGDEVLVTTDGVSRTYQVSGSTILQRGQDIPQEVMRSGQSKLLLLSCWPPGINNKRIMIEATQV